jgi:hypothetical protein
MQFEILNILEQKFFVLKVAQKLLPETVLQKQVVWGENQSNQFEVNFQVTSKSI